MDDNINVNGFEEEELQQQEQQGEQQQQQDEDKLIRVKFITKLPVELQVPETPIALPIKFTRFGLSEVINHLLDIKPQRVFDFLINGEFLRVSLQTFITKNKIIDEETVLEIEYLEALPKPEETEEKKIEDWISCIEAGIGNNQSDYLINSGYDSQIRIWKYSPKNGSNCEPAISFIAHEEPIITFKVISKDLNNNQFQLITGAKEAVIKLFNVNLTDSSSKLEKIFIGNQDSTSCLSISPSKSRFAAGGWDNHIRFWSLNDNTNQTSNSKRTRTNNKQATQITEEHVIKAHSQSVSSLKWIEESKIISTSNDQTIRVWDIESSIPVATYNSTKAIICSDVSFDQNLIATGHADSIIRLWDIRAKDGSIVKQTFLTHKMWVHGIAWHPTLNYFVSCSYDNTVKIWDLRSRVPLYTINSHEDKVLSVAWHDNNTFVSGGADGKLKIHKINNL
eukprot:TRINITY_DN247_c1_g1_i2.p1 TRINITY_DN247_c1_g1~~TRINITY_DN247_c1_g1_i2.p1  ORF type:complete len:473 (+),score=200.67 TRINITY_DN247_c1_g1_i2:68-1420(+)